MTELETRPPFSEAEYAERNNRLRVSMGKGVQALLPFELSAAKNNLASFVDRQRVLGQQLGEAMSQGAETFHDNAPADAVVSDSQTLVRMARSTMGVIQNSEGYEFVPRGGDTVTLGSVVGLRYNDDDEASYHLLTGMSALVPEDAVELPQGIEIEDGITLSSPLGRILLDRKEGDVVELIVGRHRNTISITRVI